MLWILTRLIGFALMMAGIFFLSSSIIIGGCWLVHIPALASVLFGVAGVLTLTFLRPIRNLGWILITIGIVLAFASGCIFITPISLFSFLLAFLCLSIGYQLFTSGRIRF